MPAASSPGSRGRQRREGILQLVAADSGELILNADTDDDSNVLIQLITAVGKAEFFQPWS